MTGAGLLLLGSLLLFVGQRHSLPRAHAAGLWACLHILAIGAAVAATPRAPRPDRCRARTAGAAAALALLAALGNGWDLAEVPKNVHGDVGLTVAAAREVVMGERDFFAPGLCRDSRTRRASDSDLAGALRGHDGWRARGRRRRRCPRRPRRLRPRPRGSQRTNGALCRDPLSRLYPVSPLLPLHPFRRSDGVFRVAPLGHREGRADRKSRRLARRRRARGMGLFPLLLRAGLASRRGRGSRAAAPPPAARSAAAGRGARALRPRGLGRRGACRPRLAGSPARLLPSDGHVLLPLRPGVGISSWRPHACRRKAYAPDARHALARPLARGRQRPERPGIAVARPPVPSKVSSLPPASR